MSLWEILNFRFQIPGGLLLIGSLFLLGLGWCYGWKSGSRDFDELIRSEEA